MHVYSHICTCVLGLSSRRTSYGESWWKTLKSLVLFLFQFFEMALQVLLSTELFKDSYPWVHLWNGTSVIAQKQWWPQSWKSTNTKTVDGTRSLDSLTSKCRRIACTSEMRSKAISEIVLKMARQNMSKVPYIFHHEMYWTEDNLGSDWILWTI